MKKTASFLFILLGMVLHLNAQVLNGGFETWVTDTVNGKTFENPNGWFTYNRDVLKANGASTTVGVTKTVNSHSGTYALRLETDTISNTFFSRTDTVMGYAHGTFPLTQRPQNLSVRVKFSPAGNDTALIAAAIFSAAGAEIGYVEILITTPIPSYSLVTAPITYYSALTPDSVIVGFITSRQECDFSVTGATGEIIGFSNPVGYQGMTPGTVLQVDDVQFTGVYTGIKDKSTAHDIKVFPNPATDLLTIKTNDPLYSDNYTFTIYSVLGNAVTESVQFTNEVKIPLQDIAKGIYVYTIIDNQGHMVKTEKLIVK